MKHTLVPILMASALLAIPTAVPESAAQPEAAEPRVIEVTVKRYAFEPAEIEVLEGEAVRLIVRSADGLHGVEIRDLKIKKEVPRGSQPTVIEFTAPEEGRYPVLCSEFCGNGHGDMKGALVVTAKAN